MIELVEFQENKNGLKDLSAFFSSLYLSSRAAVTKSQKPGDLAQQKRTVSELWGLKV